VRWLRPRIAFLLQHSPADASAAARPSLSVVTTEIAARLREHYGASVDLLTPDAQPLALEHMRAEHDVYVLKAKTPMTLAVAGAVAAQGATVVNTFEASTLTRDKLATTAVLAASGVPLPRSWATGRPDLLGGLIDGGPLWLKPQRGSQGKGVQRVTSTAELDASGCAAHDSCGLPLPLFAQRDVPSGGRDLKVYVVGERMWAITRPFPARTLAEKLGAPCRVPPVIREAAIACGRALGLELYGVDFLVAGDQFFAVDVNALPGYKGVPEAPAAIADYVFERTSR
jgi:ribosomal protein S6--L-glutamate ligase